MTSGIDNISGGLGVELIGRPTIDTSMNAGMQPTTEAASQDSFSAVLSSAGGNFVDSLQKAEAASIAGIKGEKTAYEVASSVMEAEQALRMTVAIRDRVVQAYLEISRMQI